MPATKKSSTSKTKTLLIANLPIKRAQGIAVIAAVVVIGVSLLVYTRAATGPSSMEAEKGSLSTNATVVNDSNASGGQAVRFGGGSTSTPTPTPTPTSTPTGPACVITAIVDNGNGNTFCPGPGQYYTDTNIYGNNNKSYVANAVPFLISNVSQTLTAYGPENWHTVTSIPNGNTSVVAAPQTRVDLMDTNGGKAIPLSNFPALYSSFAENMQNNPGVAYDAGYDVWGGDANSSGTKYEMMIWIDQKLRGTCGGASKLVTTTFGGTHGAPTQNWTLCHNGSGSTAEFIWYLSDASGNAVNEQSGTVDILPFSKYMVSHGYYPSNYGLTQVVFGNEICSTGSGPATFTVSKFTLSGN